MRNIDPARKHRPLGVEATEGPSRRRFAVSGAARRGFSLAECLIACVVLGIAASGLAIALAAAHQSAAFADERGDMVLAARGLMEEIASRPFVPPALSDKPGWSLGQTDRTQYDDVFDFDGYLDVLPLADLSRSRVGEPESTPGYRRSVRVQPRSDPATPIALKEAAAFAYVEVTVQSPSGDRFVLPYWASRTMWRK
jgi:prepilin-type N-terminal cleavage/methylation domain-containing protein